MFNYTQVLKKVLTFIFYGQKESDITSSYIYYVFYKSNSSITGRNNFMGLAVVEIIKSFGTSLLNAMSFSTTFTLTTAIVNFVTGGIFNAIIGFSSLNNFIFLCYISSLL